MNIRNIVPALLLSFVAVSAAAEDIKIPAKNPVITVTIPDSWKPEQIKTGAACESPDKVVTILFEIAASEKGISSLIDENMDWLVKEQGIKFNAEAKDNPEFSVGGIKSTLKSYHATSKEFGPANVGFIFTPVGDKVLITTYRITVQGFEKHDATMTTIMDSVRPAK